MWMLIIKAVLTILPIIVQAVRDGRIKEATRDEVLREIEREHKARVDAAAAARSDVLAGRVRNSPGHLDPNRRD